MTWTDKSSDKKTFLINSDTEKGVARDLKRLITEINGDEFIDCSEILVFIDATNGNLFISGFDSKTAEVLDEKGIFVQLTEFWEEHQDAYDFDEIIKCAIRTAYKESEKTLFKSKFRVFYQTEDDSEIRPL